MTISEAIEKLQQYDPDGLLVDEYGNEIENITLIQHGDMDFQEQVEISA